jgi:hypothetical protein
VFKGLPSLDGHVTIHDIGTNDLEHRAFSVDGPAVLEITAFGSLEDESDDPVAGDMAAQAWITRRSDRTLIWKIDPRANPPRHGTLVHVEDTVRVDAGTYDLYFASYGVERHASGNFVFRFNGTWKSDRKNWQVAIRLRDGQPTRLKLQEDDLAKIGAPNGESVIWSTGPMRGHGTAEQLFSVTSRVPVSVYSIGEWCGDMACDTGWIENVATGDEVWKLTDENTVQAGGSRSNRVFRGIVSLDPGTYRATYSTDAGHAFDDWYGNPPFDPSGWGLALGVVNESGRERIQLFDLWEEGKPLISMTRIRDDEHRSTAFVVQRTTPIVAYSVGELRSSGSRYDYGWIEDATGERVWEMSWGASTSAGGNRDNRVEQAFLVLDPGRYVAHYESDGSHSFDDWNRDMPSNPERWGLTIFLLNGVDNGVVRVVESAEAGTATSDASGTASGTGPGPASGTIAVQVGASQPSSTD